MELVEEKGSVAKVTLTPGTGKITVNGRDVHEYMPYEVLVMDLKQPLVVTNNENTFDVNAEVIGGGFQDKLVLSDLVLQRALLVYDEDNVSVRSGARASMPGMMDTILNLGLNDEAVEFC